MLLWMRLEIRSRSMMTPLMKFFHFTRQAWHLCVVAIRRGILALMAQGHMRRAFRGSSGFTRAARQLKLRAIVITL